MDRGKKSLGSLSKGKEEGAARDVGGKLEYGFLEAAEENLQEERNQLVRCN